MDEFRQGRRESSMVSAQTVDSLTKDEREVWRTIRKELEEIGITVTAFEANRDFILTWFVRAVEAGAFEEQHRQSEDEKEPSQGPSSAAQQSSHSSPQQEVLRPSNLPGEVRSSGQTAISHQRNPSLSIRRKPVTPVLTPSADTRGENLPEPANLRILVENLPEVVPWSEPTKVLPEVTPTVRLPGNLPEPASNTLFTDNVPEPVTVPAFGEQGPIVAEEPSDKVSNKKSSRVTRLSALVAGVSLPNQRLVHAAKSTDGNATISKLLSDPTSRRLITKNSLDQALLSVCRLGLTNANLIPTVKLLLDCGGNASCLDQFGRSLLTNVLLPMERGFGTEDRFFALVDLLLDNGADPNHQGGSYPGEANDSPLIRCILGSNHRHCETALIVLAKLFARGADPNARKSPTTYLQFAIQRRNIQAVGLLLDHGADPDASSTKETQTPLMMTIREEHSQIMKVLLEHRANVNLCTKEHGTPLMHAVFLRKTNSIQNLIFHGADVRLTIRDEGLRVADSPVEAAFRLAYPEALELLVAAGAILEPEYAQNLLIRQSRAGPVLRMTLEQVLIRNILVSLFDFLSRHRGIDSAYFKEEFMKANTPMRYMFLNPS